jgi:2-polyprenyl-6-methoxyphenol hydroxylase-like FAD-dependent oxidoreductase
MASRRVVVVGAGPAGAAVSLLLARAGVNVTLIERERTFDRAFRGEALMPTGLDALRALGVWDRVEALPWRLLEAWEIYLDRQPIMQVAEPSATLGERALRVVPQPQLLELLVAEAASLPEFTFVPGAAARGLISREGKIAGVLTAISQGTREFEADLVIGCDGRASLVRKRSGLPLDLLPESYDVIWFKLPVPERLRGRRPILIFASGPDVALAYVSWDDRLQVAWLVGKGAWRELRGRDWLAECTRLLPAWLADHFHSARTEMEGPTPLDVVVGRCRRWSMPGLLLLGDAAHPMSPVRAQGINMALRDAIVAANHLIVALWEGTDTTEASVAIEAERMPEIRRVQTLQLRELRGQRWARERPWLVRPLLRLAPRLAKSGWLQRAWLWQQRELRFGVTKVALRPSPTRTREGNGSLRPFGCP